MSLVRCVDVSVLTIMGDKLVKISEGNAKYQVISCIHDKKIESEIKCNVLFVGGDSMKGNKEIANNLSDQLDSVICHKQAIVC